MELYIIIQPIKRVLFQEQVLKVSVKLGKSVKVPRELLKSNFSRAELAELADATSALTVSRFLTAVDASKSELACCNALVFLQL